MVLGCEVKNEEGGDRGRPSRKTISFAGLSFETAMSKGWGLTWLL